LRIVVILLAAGWLITEASGSIDSFHAVFKSESDALSADELSQLASQAAMHPFG